VIANNINFSDRNCEAWRTQRATKALAHYCRRMNRRRKMWHVRDATGALRVILRTQKQPEYTTLMEMSWCTATYVTRCCDPTDINTEGNTFIVQWRHGQAPHPSGQLWLSYISLLIDQYVSKVIAFSSIVMVHLKRYFNVKSLNRWECVDSTDIEVIRAFLSQIVTLFSDIKTNDKSRS